MLKLRSDSIEKDGLTQVPNKTTVLLMTTKNFDSTSWDKAQDRLVKLVVGVELLLKMSSTQT